MSFTISSIIATVKRDGVVEFHKLAEAIEEGAAAIAKALGPSYVDFITREVSTAKQFVSDAITMADSSIGSHQQSIALAVEQAIDSQLTIATGGKSVPFNGITNHFVDELVQAAIDAAHNAGLAIKTALAQDSGQQLVAQKAAPLSGAAGGSAEPSQAPGQA